MPIASSSLADGNVTTGCPRRTSHGMKGRKFRSRGCRCLRRFETELRKPIRSRPPAKARTTPCRSRQPAASRPLRGVDGWPLSARSGPARDGCRAMTASMSGESTAVLDSVARQPAERRNRVGVHADLVAPGNPYTVCRPLRGRFGREKNRVEHPGWLLLIREPHVQRRRDLFDMPSHGGFERRMHHQHEPLDYLSISIEQIVDHRAAADGRQNLRRGGLKTGAGTCGRDDEDCLRRAHAVSLP